ncbi:LuxR C-terminal-related transcriptional regulator [Pseudonocardia sp. H11422]|uniref:LuxR C-terminal-related transcriptional regulator n=1 Tax=Pseudonocardia sp. H11422 TaxID=2835866 RepID=UPI001BDDBF0E|nr:LuxR C-terminal-related transcriptional regulator [Pseudonocardia sp. H11422]
MRRAGSRTLVDDGTVSGDPKYTVPLAGHLVPRPRLHDRLTTGLEAPLTLVAAPAGWGKTLLASSWLACGGAGRAAAWISLGLADDDVRALWVAVATALAPVVGERAGARLLQVVVDDDLEHVPGQVAAALAEDGTPVVLVLDNLHELTSLAVHESLLRLVQRPPEGVRFVVTTRRDPPWPLHRMRLAGILTEVRAADLAFRPEETAALFGQLGVHLDDGQLGRLVERTDGWAAGLRLAALELQTTEDAAAFVDAFSGDDHAVAAYLLSEVIDRLEPALLDFLVRVSILDLVCADLADALTGEQSGAATLADLAASNLFVQAVGHNGRWYRLHRLIADVLRTRISDPRTVRDLHRRAAEWYRMQSMPLDAVRYAVRGGLWSLAADLVGPHVLALLLRGSAREVDVLLSTVPRDALLGRAELAAALAAARVLQGLTAEVGVLVDAARAGADALSQQRRDRVRVVVDLIEMGSARSRGDLAALAAACRRVPHDPRVLAALGLTGWDMVPLLVLSNAGTAELWTGDVLEAEKHLRAAVDANRWSGFLRPHLNAESQLALLECARGDLGPAREDALATIARATERGWALTPQAVAAYVALAQVALDQDEPAEVDRWLRRIGEVEAIAPEPHVRMAAAALNAVRRADAGDREGALGGLRATTLRLGRTAPPVLADRLLLVEAELLRGMGDLRRAGEVLAGLRGPASAHTAHAVARLHLAAGDVTAAEDALAPFVPDGATAVRQQVDGGVLRALLAAARHDESALRHLEDALLAAAPQGMRRAFLTEAAQLRALLGTLIAAGTGAAAFAVDLLGRMSGSPGHAPAAPAVLVEDLTEREQVVLRYLASTLSNAEIAAELYLSINTIKTHQRMIYRKLGADGRRAAVRRARELRLL